MLWDICALTCAMWSSNARVKTVFPIQEIPGYGAAVNSEDSL